MRLQELLVSPWDPHFCHSMALMKIPGFVLAFAALYAFTWLIDDILWSHLFKPRNFKPFNLKRRLLLYIMYVHIMHNSIIFLWDFVMKLFAARCTCFVAVFFRKIGHTTEMVHLALGVCVSYLLLFCFKHLKIELRIALWK